MVLLDHINVDKVEHLNKYQLEQVVGGVNLTGSLITSFTKAITSLMDIGRSLGTAIRRVAGKSVCPVK